MGEFFDVRSYYGYKQLAAGMAIIAMHIAMLTYHGVKKIGSPNREMRTFMLVPIRQHPEKSFEIISDKKSLQLHSSRPLKEKSEPLNSVSDSEPVREANFPVTDNPIVISENWMSDSQENKDSLADKHAESRLLARRADVEFRNGKLAPLEVTETPLKRMRSKLSQADRSGTNGTKTIISTTGEAITVMIRNGKIRCYVPLSTNIAPSAVLDKRAGGGSSEINCPPELSHP